MSPNPGIAVSLRHHALPALVALSCALSTGLLVKSQFSSENGLFDVPPELLVRTFLSNSLASPFTLHWQGQQFGSAILQVTPSVEEGPGWAIRLGATGRMPGSPKSSLAWNLRLRCLIDSRTRSLRSATLDLDSKDPALLLAARSDFRDDQHTLRIGPEDAPALVFTGNATEIREELRKRLGWSAPLSLESLGPAGASAARIVRGRVEPAGRPIEIFIIRPAGALGASVDFLCAISVTGQPLYLRLPGGFEALPDGVSSEDLAAFKNLR